MKTSLRFPRQARSAKALRTHRPYSWWRRICRSCSWLSSASTNCCRIYGAAGGGRLAPGGEGGGAVGGGMNAGASARKPLPAAAAGGGGVWPAPTCPDQADHAAALPKGEAPSMHWRPPCPDRGGDLHPGARRSRSLFTLEPKRLHDQQVKHTRTTRAPTHLHKKRHICIMNKYFAGPWPRAR